MKLGIYIESLEAWCSMQRLSSLNQILADEKWVAN